jgi:Ser-tRNA(Ala) deacylase AlaX
MVTMGGVGCPCGGTHVRNVGEIVSVTVTKVQKKKAAVRVSYTIA